MIKSEEAVYSKDEDFNRCYDDLDDVFEDVAQDCESDAEFENIEEFHLYKGVKNKFEFSDFVDVDDIIERMQLCAFDNGAGDFAEDYLEDVTTEMKEELKQLLISWAKTHNLKPNFYLIEDEKKFTVSRADYKQIYK